jgi:Flp pilus assembly protein TadB
VASHDQPVLVTTAGRSPQQDRRDRERRYLITMGFRVVAFVVALIVTKGWIRVIAIIAAMVLPWIAVIFANSGPSRSPAEHPSLYSRRRPRELE